MGVAERQQTRRIGQCRPAGREVDGGHKWRPGDGGIPGTGLSGTERLSLTSIGGALDSIANARLSGERAEWRQAFVEHLFACLENREVTVAQVKAALAYRETLRLTDEEMGPELLKSVAMVVAKLCEAEAMGRRTFYDPAKW